MTKFTFHKSERLTNKTHIDLLFNKGKAFYAPPLKLIFLKNNTDTFLPTQILITVPKRNFKKAVHRNYIKRLIRENYRLNKHLFQLNKPNSPLLIAIIYQNKEKPTFDLVENKLNSLLQRLSNEI